VASATIIAVGRTRRSNERPCALQQVRLDVDGVDARGDAGERDREQPVAAAKIDHDHAGLDAHFDKNLCGIGPQHLPPVSIGHRCCRKKAYNHAVLMRAKDLAFLTARRLNHSGD
jgi:hypothetical protein